MQSLELTKRKRLSELSTFKIGGPARYFIEARTIAAVQEAFRFCAAEEIPYFILGKGSNCLFDDQGFDGLVMRVRIDHCESLGEGRFFVGAGHSFSRLGQVSARQGWAGLEFASCIPGSVGGAVYMNAGANGSETCGPLESVDFVGAGGELRHFTSKDLDYSYRKSPFQEMDGCIVSATFGLRPDSGAKARQLDIISQRKASQPLSDASAGCVFRNPQHRGAGALIDQANLKGLRVGAAEVSPKHANFIVNRGGASSADVLQLIEQVKEKTGEDLQMEIYYIPFRGS